MPPVNGDARGVLHLRVVPNLPVGFFGLRPRPKCHGGTPPRAFAESKAMLSRRPGEPEGRFGAGTHGSSS